MFKFLGLVAGVYYVSQLLKDVNKEELKDDLVELWNKNSEGFKKVAILINDLIVEAENIDYEELRLNLEKKYNSGRRIFRRLSSSVAKTTKKDASSVKGQQSETLAKLDKLTANYEKVLAELNELKKEVKNKK